MSGLHPKPPCWQCRRNLLVMTLQRELMLDLANGLGIDLNDLPGDTEDAEWESLCDMIRMTFREAIKDGRG